MILARITYLNWNQKMITLQPKPGIFANETQDAQWQMASDSESARLSDGHGHWQLGYGMPAVTVAAVGRTHGPQAGGCGSLSDSALLRACPEAHGRPFLRSRPVTGRIMDVLRTCKCRGGFRSRKLKNCSSL
jgi:hypothetical protein